MTDPAKNIQCGTYYLQLLLDDYHTQTVALERYGTGLGFADNVLTCESCSSGGIPSDIDACLRVIHP
jgi:hypothetical protein